MECSNGERALINSFALVSYIPEPLAGFLDELRMELVEECRARAHVTVLPPRPLAAPAEDPWPGLERHLHDFQPFQVELGTVEIFPVTQVVYIEVIAGQVQLKQLHTALNAGPLAFEEPFEYHPHVTLAQDLEPSAVASIYEKAVARWKDCREERSFLVNRLTFVQNTLDNRWTDLHGCALAGGVTI